MSYSESDNKTELYFHSDFDYDIELWSAYRKISRFLGLPNRPYKYWTLGEVKILGCTYNQYLRVCEVLNADDYSSFVNRELKKDLGIDKYLENFNSYNELKTWSKPRGFNRKR